MSDTRAVDNVPFSIVKGNVINILTHYTEGLSYDDLLRTYKCFYGSDLEYESYGYESVAECLENIPGLEPKMLNGVLKVVLSFPLELLSSGDDYVSSELLENAKISNDKRCSPEIDERLKTKIKELLLQYPKGIFSRNFPAKFKALYDEEFDLPETGYYNLIDLVNALPDICVRVQPDGCESDWLLFPTQSASSKHLLKNFKQDKCENYSQIEFKNIIPRIRRILQAYPDGIFIHEFNSVYGMNCEIPLNIQKLGYTSLSSFFLDITDDVPLKFAYTDGAMKVFYGHSENIKEIAGNSQLPSNIVLPGMRYHQQKLPNVEENEYFPVHIAWAQSPSELYIQLDDDSLTKEFLNMSSELSFYDTPSSELYKMQPQHIIPNAPCVAMWSDGAWYRSKIIRVEAELVEVQFVDYGNTEIVSKENLKYLQTCHFAIPTQAIRTRLYCTRPDRVWAHDDYTNLLSNFFSNSKEYSACIVNSQICPNIASIILCYTENPDDNCINALLVQEGLAIHFEEHLDAIQNLEASTNKPLSYEENKEQGETFFTSDDDEALVAMCQKRYVQRVYLNNDCTIHVVCVEDDLYIPDCDIIKLFWPTENSATLQRRLRQCDIFVPYKIVSENDYPSLFYQLLCYNIDGVKHVAGRTSVSLYLLQDLLIILNAFGHPSLTIRGEISQAIEQCNPSSTIWQSFIEPSKEERQNKTANTGKFEQLCLYDLYTILEGLKFKRLQNIKALKNHCDKQIPAQAWEKQIEKYQQRIREITILCQ